MRARLAQQSRRRLRFRSERYDDSQCRAPPRSHRRRSRQLNDSRETREGNVSDPEKLGGTVGKILLNRGGEKILEAV